MGIYETSGCTGSDVVLRVPDMCKESEPEPMRELSGLEKIVLRERGRAMEEVELRYMLRYVKAEYMQDELARRNGVASGVISKLKEKTHSIPSNMTYDEMLSLIKEVREIVRQGGQDYGLQ